MIGKFAKIVKKLSSQNELRREEAVKELEHLNVAELHEHHLQYLIQSSAVVFKDDRDEMIDCSSVLLNFVFQYEITDPKTIDVLVKTFPNMSIWARSIALSMLTHIQTSESLESFLWLLDRYIDELPLYDFHFHLDGSEEEVAMILLPRLFDYIDYPMHTYNIFRYTWNCLEKGTIDARKIEDLLPFLIHHYTSLKEKIKPYQVENIDYYIWNEDYQQYRVYAGLYLDIMGYFDQKELISFLEEASTFTDLKLKCFAILSLLKLNKKVEFSFFEEIAANDEMRNHFFNSLKKMNLLSLYPQKYMNQVLFAQCEMINWLTYPTELGRTPSAIEHMDTIVRYDEQLGDVEFYLFRFKSDDKEWKEKGWMAGVAGPFIQSKKPTTISHGYTFSLFESWHLKQSHEHLESVFNVLNGYWEELNEE